MVSHAFYQQREDEALQPPAWGEGDKQGMCWMNGALLDPRGSYPPSTGVDVPQRSLLLCRGAAAMPHSDTVTHLDTLLHCTSVEEVQDWADFILLRDWRTGAYTAPSSSDLSKHIKVWFLYDISFSFFNSRMVWFLFCFLRWHITQIFCFFNNNSTHDFWPVCLVRLGSPAGGPGCELT